jgi:hypothetical protein
MQELRRQLRSVQRARTAKRKAGLLYDVPLYNEQLAPPLRGLPEPRTVGEEAKMQWMRVGSAAHAAVPRALALRMASPGRPASRIVPSCSANIGFWVPLQPDRQTRDAFVGIARAAVAAVRL